MVLDGSDGSFGKTDKMAIGILLQFSMAFFVGQSDIRTYSKK